MSNYQRLISYIYAYEGGIRGKNVGYAKLETRGAQCRITVSVKRIYVGGNPIGVYLLAGDKEVRIGTLFARNGAGEYRAVVSVQNIEGSGFSLEECYGLTVHDTESAWRCYTTVWEDAVAHAAEIELADVTSEQTGQKQETQQLQGPSVSKEIEEEVEREELEQLGILRIREKKDAETEEEPVPETVSAEMEDEQTQEPAESETEFMADLEESEREELKTEELEKNAAVKTLEQDESAIIKMENPEEEAEKEAAEENGLEEEPETRRLTSSIPSPFRKGEEAKSEEEIWEMLRSRYPRILAFDYEDGCEILTIKPQDIGLLPRENWIYGSNSFLLHGYYYYRYLILARLNQPNGSGRYLLGVPGHYVSNERYMAAMFGFSEFVLSKKQPPKDSRFGYWYTDIKIHQ